MSVVADAAVGPDLDLRREVGAERADIAGILLPVELDRVEVESQRSLGDGEVLFGAIEPAVGRMSCITVRDRVDLPQPDSPTSPRISPFPMDRFTPSTARMVSTVGAKTEPARLRKWVWRSRISR